MPRVSPLTEQFLLAAKHEEINALQHLAISCKTLITLGHFIHQLQKERGISNIFIASGCERFVQQRREQIAQSIESEQQLYTELKQHYLNSKHSIGNTRLFNRITFSLQCLARLPILREQIRNQKVTAEHASQAFSQHISSLLNILLEAADGASDPLITRLLIALFNFVQAKEHAGQERACGAIGFASGAFSTQRKDQLAHLQNTQQDNFIIFLKYAGNDLTSAYAQLTEDEASVQLQRLRNLIQELPQGSSQLSEISEVWYDITTTRINHMHRIEKLIAEQLTTSAEKQIHIAKRQLHEHKNHIKALSDIPLDGSGSSVDYTSNNSNLAQHRLTSNRTFYDLIMEQSEHLKQMNDALQDAKQVISEQKTLNRAKLILIQHLDITEEQAHKRLQKQAMDQQCSLFEVAKHVLKAMNKDQHIISS
ncbi:hypothetical protein B5G52_06410 [Pseudoalteromonas sp. A601]|uniref:nitrate regulatory protein n=1 Tax=Pseudoalteromonas sp. A601 TaxID=1967839 RepID=UPI000B3C9A50|nr:nitrate regulatory protein [Pseudoalteromonas sp. A601]OUS72816.1 hypothetical protein B5G52_06410 [Pseudoalteromonas sp. A601]